MPRTFATRRFATAAVSVLASATLVTACSSSGGDSGSAPSQSQIESKLKNDSTIKTELSTISSNASALDLAITCIAKVLRNGGKPSDLNDYVSGRKKLADIRGKSGVSADDAKTGVENCVKNGAAKGSATP